MTGEVIVTNVAPGTPMSVEFTTTQTGYAPGTGTATETSIVGDARVPDFVNVQRLATGFTAQIDNFGDGFSFTVDSIDPPGAGHSISDTGLVTVSGLTAGQEATVTIKTTKQGYHDGSAPLTKRALDPQCVIDFDDPAVPADRGFSVQITNWGDCGEGFTWAGSATETTDPVQISGTGLVTVTGVAPGTESTVTVTANKTGYLEGSNQKTGRSNNGPAKMVTFSDYTRTAGGFTAADRWLQPRLSVDGFGDEHF